MSENKSPTLAYVISTKRQQLGLKQRELAKDIGINHSTISRLENPDSGIVADPRTLKALADRLGLDYNYLLSLNKTVDDQPDLRVIARASKKMTEEDRQKMMDMLRAEFEDAFSDVDSDGFDEGEDDGFL